MLLSERRLLESFLFSGIKELLHSLSRVSASNCHKENCHFHTQKFQNFYVTNGFDLDGDAINIPGINDGFIFFLISFSKLAIKKVENKWPREQPIATFLCLDTKMSRL